jgi:hypothetical protein
MAADAGPDQLGPQRHHDAAEEHADPGIEHRADDDGAGMKAATPSAVISDTSTHASTDA